MSLTPNYSLIIPTGSDAVNLLTQCYPNFTSLDSILKPIQESGVTVATDTKVGTVHQLVRTDSSCNMFRFIATANYAAGDTFTVDGASVTATAMDGSSIPAGSFVINQSVVCILNNLVLTVLIPGKTTSISASAVTYDNTGSGLTATNAQDAIDELHNSANVAYDNTVSGLTATTVQSAIDEIVGGGGGADHGVVELWLNPNINQDFGAQSIVITSDKQIDTFLIETGTENGDSHVLCSSELGHSGEANRMGISGTGEITNMYRVFTFASAVGGYTVSVTDASVRVRANNGTVTNSTDNSKLVPLRILGVMHNS